MRQAGRALKKYRELREGIPFLRFCKDPQLVSKATILPVQELGVDAGILFHDILLPLEAWGMQLLYDDGSPRVHPSIQSFGDLRKIPTSPDGTALEYLGEVVRMTRSELPRGIPLIGFIPGPYTLLEYLTGGDTAFAQELLSSQVPSCVLFRRNLLELLSLHAEIQVRAGADLLQIFDTWIIRLPREYMEKGYRSFLIDLLERLPRVPVLYFGKGTRDHIHTLRELPVTGLSCDETITLPEARSFCPSLVLQGNFPPEYLLGDPSFIQRELRRMLEQMREDPAYIVNLSHGVLPQTPEENLRLFVETVHELRAH